MKSDCKIFQASGTVYLSSCLDDAMLWALEFVINVKDGPFRTLQHTSLQHGSSDCQKLVQVQS